MRYGFQVSISRKGGIAGAALEAELLGLSAIQIFAKSPRNWKTRSLKLGEVEDFRARKENLGHLVGVIHASHLVNLGASGDLWEKSVFSLADDLSKAQILGIEYVVVHPGSGDPEQVRAGAMKARELASTGKSGPQLLLENMPSSSQIGSALEDLAGLIKGTPLGVCFDTCHAFTAGYALHQDPAGMVSLLDKTIGLARVPIIHLSDSLSDWGSHLDQHANLLEGQMGEALREFVLDPRLSQKVFILETHRGTQDDAHNLRVLRRWIGAGAA